MRIISGKAGGIPVLVPKTVLRPTADRVRESVFSILQEVVEGAVVLDLFAGSGSYGLECLSRGAARCVFVDSERASADCISATLKKARLSGGTVVTAPADAWLKTRAVTAGPFSLIFADPPYLKQKTDRDWDAELLASPGLRAVTAPRGVLVLESFARSRPATAPGGEWTLLDERTRGDSRLSFFRLADSPPVSPDASVPHPADL